MAAADMAGVESAATTTKSLDAEDIVHRQRRQRWLLNIGTVAAFLQGSLMPTTRLAYGLLFHRLFQLPDPTDAPLVEALMLPSWDFYDIAALTIGLLVFIATMNGLGRACFARWGEEKTVEFRLRVVACASIMPTVPAGVNVQHLLGPQAENVRLWHVEHAYHFVVDVTRMLACCLCVFFVDYRVAALVVGLMTVGLSWRAAVDRIGLAPRLAALRKGSAGWMVRVMDVVSGHILVLVSNMAETEVAGLRRRGEAFIQASGSFTTFLFARQAGVMFFISLVGMVPLVMLKEILDNPAQQIFTYYLYLSLMQSLQLAYDSIVGMLVPRGDYSRACDHLQELYQLADAQARRMDMVGGDEGKPAAGGGTAAGGDGAGGAAAGGDGAGGATAAACPQVVVTIDDASPPPTPVASASTDVSAASPKPLSSGSPSGSAGRQPVSSLGSTASSGGAARLAASPSLQSLLSAAEGSASPKRRSLPRQQGGLTPLFGSGGLELRDATLGYWRTEVHNSQGDNGEAGGVTQTAVPVLTDVNIHIPEGALVGITGETGCGKTTLLRALIGILPPLKGVVLASGRDIYASPIEEWWDSITVIPQTAHLFRRSVQDNIAYGLPAEQVTESGVRRAATAAVAYDFIDALPGGRGVHTALVRGGEELSGGQRQRLHLARAMARNSAWVVLDEPMAALDFATQERVADNLVATLDSYQRRPTCIMVTHRESLLRRCSIVLHVSQGHVTMERRGTPTIGGSLATLAAKPAIARAVAAHVQRHAADAKPSST